MLKFIVCSLYWNANIAEVVQNLKSEIDRKFTECYNDHVGDSCQWVFYFLNLFEYRKCDYMKSQAMPNRASKMLFPLHQLRRFKIRATQAADRAAAKKKYNQRKKQVDEMKADYDEWHNKQMLYSQPVTLTNLACARAPVK